MKTLRLCTLVVIVLLFTGGAVLSMRILNASIPPSFG